MQNFSFHVKQLSFPWFINDLQETFFFWHLKAQNICFFVFGLLPLAF